MLQISWSRQKQCSGKTDQNSKTAEETDRKVRSDGGSSVPSNRRAQKEEQNHPILRFKGRNRNVRLDFQGLCHACSCWLFFFLSTNLLQFPF